MEVSSPLVSKCCFLRRKANSAWDMQEQEWELRAEIQGNSKRGKSAKGHREMLGFFQSTGQAAVGGRGFVRPYDFPES